MLRHDLAFGVETVYSAERQRRGHDRAAGQKLLGVDNFSRLPSASGPSSTSEW